MRIFIFLLFSFLLTQCANTSKVYWCGDHPCINKKEKEAYFRETMIVEIRNIKDKSYKKDSNFEKIMKNAKIKEKKRILNEKDLKKQAKLEEKRRIKEEKKLLKQAKLEEKRRIKEEKELERQAKINEKDLTIEKEEIIREIEMEEKSSEKNFSLNKTDKNPNPSGSTFKEIVDNIFKKNNSKSFPDINNIPN